MPLRATISHLVLRFPTFFMYRGISEHGEVRCSGWCFMCPTKIKLSIARTPICYLPLINGKKAHAGAISALGDLFRLQNPSRNLGWNALHRLRIRADGTRQSVDR